MRKTTPIVVAALVLFISHTLAAPAQQSGQLRPPDVIWVPTQDDVVAAMLKLANVT